MFGSVKSPLTLSMCGVGKLKLKYSDETSSVFTLKSTKLKYMDESDTLFTLKFNFELLKMLNFRNLIFFVRPSS